MLRLERTSGLWSKVRKLNLSVDQMILFSKNIFTADYLVFAFVVYKQTSVNVAIGRVEMPSFCLMVG